ncbi:MAG: formate dehydrogenase subunit gamma [Geminicoccaceae bacterium]
MRIARIRHWATIFTLAVGISLHSGCFSFFAVSFAQESATQAPPELPAHMQPSGSDSDIWRQVREGDRFQSQIQDPNAAVMVQSEGEAWRAVRNGPYTFYSAIALVAVTALLALFYLIRGRIRIDEGLSGRTVQRFDDFERFIHWLTATSFIVLAITGSLMLFGRHFLIDVIGKDAFAAFMAYGKPAHNYLGFAFMLGFILMFVRWVWHNLPNHYDLIWLAKGGGFVTRSHPPAKKFNAGQKVIFWSTVLGGLSLSLSGIALMFPFTFALFAGTFELLNSWFGLGLPTDLSPIQEMQYATLWHGIVGIGLTAIIIAHIYIGTIGMQGAFAAMGSGDVDYNWAKEHHSLWVRDLEQRKHKAAPQEAAAGDD